MCKVTIYTGGNYLVRESLFPGFCNYTHPHNVTCNHTDTRHGLSFKGGGMTSLGVVIGHLTVYKSKTFSAVLPSANWPVLTVLTYIFLQALLSSLKICSFTICITFWITQAPVCIGIPLVYQLSGITKIKIISY